MAKCVKVVKVIQRISIEWKTKLNRNWMEHFQWVFVYSISTVYVYSFANDV